MLVLSAADVSAILTSLSAPHFDKLQNEMQAALCAFTDDRLKKSGRIRQPPRTHFTVKGDITTLVMPVSYGEYTAVKTVALTPGRAATGSINLFSTTGELQGVLSALEITAFRTALATACLLRQTVWASPSVVPQSMVIFGSGKQAEWHMRLVLRTVRIKEVCCVNRGRTRLQQLETSLFEELRAQYPEAQFSTLVQEGNSSYAADLDRVLAASDIVCCTTPSRAPLFAASSLGLTVNGHESATKGRFLSLIGSYKPEMVEIDTETLKSGSRGRVLVDSIEDCLIESGELIKARLNADELVEVGQLFVAGFSDATLLAKDQNVVFKCVGLGLMDLTVAYGLLDIAKELGKGASLEPL